MPNTIAVKFQEHFKLYVLFKDYIFFESLLNQNKIDYYTEISENSFISEGVRYIFLDIDREKIDEILKEHKIIVSTETIKLVDYNDEKKVIKFQIYTYIIVTIIVIILFMDNLTIN